MQPVLEVVELGFQLFVEDLEGQSMAGGVRDPKGFKGGLGPPLIDGSLGHKDPKWESAFLSLESL